MPNKKRKRKEIEQYTQAQENQQPQEKQIQDNQKCQELSLDDNKSEFHQKLTFEMIFQVHSTCY